MGILEQGYNEISLRIKDNTTVKYIKNAEVSWAPLMHMTSMLHSCPYSAVEKVTENGTLYSGYIMFQMAQNETEYWDLKIDYTIDEVTYTITEVIDVPASAKRKVNTFMGSDGTKYLVALITSLKFNYKPKLEQIDNWETKLYFNTITHTMDDTKRPDVPIHMEMPGWSDTYGFYSKINGKYKKHQFLANLSSFYNRSVAEMTMYPSDPNENLMFMYTWPDVRTLYSGIYLEDNYEINCHSNLKFTTNLGFHNNNVASDFGLQSLQIFYPEMEASNSRFLKSISTNYFYNKDGISYGVGMGYGERAPSVSEGYGFYLYNSFDGFDYIGNLNLKNEKSLEGNANVGFKNAKWQTKLSASYFHIYDYIIGIPDVSVAPMTIGANGIKIYTALDYATIFSSDFTVSYQLSDDWIWKGQFVYNSGKDNENNGLPFMSPFNYMISLGFRPGKFTSELQLKGNATQTKYNAFYGEDKTADYAILNANFGYKFTFDKAKLVLNTGVENIFDAYYTTYIDWKNLPRMGRNIFINLMFQF